MIADRNCVTPSHDSPFQGGESGAGVSYARDFLNRLAGVFGG